MIPNTFNRTKVVLDIETLPCDDATKGLLPPVKPPGTTKTASGIAKWMAEKSEGAAIDQHLKTSFDGAFGRIFCVGMLIAKGNNADGRVFYGDERSVICSVWDELFHIDGLFQVIGHNLFNFDLPFLNKRSIIHGVKPTRSINMARYRSDAVYDTMQMWGNWSFGDSIKLDTLAKVLGLGGKTEGVDGSHVYPMWLEGKHREIAEYCCQDVLTNYLVYCTMTFSNPVCDDSIDPALIELT
jgi:hypothetical protein